MAFGAPNHPKKITYKTFLMGNIKCMMPFIKCMKGIIKCMKDITNCMKGITNLLMGIINCMKGFTHPLMGIIKCMKGITAFHSWGFLSTERGRFLRDARLNALLPLGCFHISTADCLPRSTYRLGPYSTVQGQKPYRPIEKDYG